MIKKILVVNCGEIVMCIFCICWVMNIVIVVIYIWVDWGVLYVCYVEEVYCIFDFLEDMFYLKLEKIL